MKTKRRKGFPFRLKTARRDAGVTQQDLALSIGVHPATAGHWEGGRNAPSVEHMEAIARRLGVRFAWLAVGEGAMRDPVGSD